MIKQMCLAMSLVVMACGGNDGGGGGGEADAMTPQPLTCKSIALCTTYDVKTFIGTVPAPAGGTVADGVYRLAYVMDPSNIDEEPGYHADLDALAIRGNQFNWAGFHQDSIGTWTTSGTNVTFQDTRNCIRGSEDSTSDWKSEYGYTATTSELRLFSHVRRSDGVEWDRMYVYKQASGPADVCSTVSSEPATPGDSARCDVLNCACFFAIEGTVNECT